MENNFRRHFGGVILNNKMKSTMYLFNDTFLQAFIFPFFYSFQLLNYLPVYWNLPADFASLFVIENVKVD